MSDNGYYLMTKDQDGAVTYRIHGPYTTEEAVKAAGEAVDFVNDSALSVVGYVDQDDLESQLEDGVEYVQTINEAGDIVVSDEPTDGPGRDRIHVHENDKTPSEQSVVPVSSDPDAGGDPGTGVSP